jgi:hypothetical protein
VRISDARKSTSDKIVRLEPAHAAAQHAAGADAASGPKIGAILRSRFYPPIVSIYRCDAAQRQAVGPPLARDLAEHVIGGANVFQIAHAVFRNQREDYVDLSFGTACGRHYLRCTDRLSQIAEPNLRDRTTLPDRLIPYHAY